MLKLTILLIVMALLALGCAGMEFFSGSPSTQQVLAKIAIQQATVRAIQASGEEKTGARATGEETGARATAVVSFVDEALEVLRSDDDNVISAEQLFAALTLVLPSDLSPADQLLVSQLVELLVAEVNARIPEDQRELPVAEVSVVLNWVRAAAAVLVPTV